MSLATNIRKYRIQRGLSQNRVAQYLQIKAGTYQAYEARRAEPSVHTLAELRDLYGLSSIDAFLRGTDKPAPSIDTKYRQLNKRDRAIVDAVLSG
jgi:transcriptional regulator with XRE-family HTH domain